MESLLAGKNVLVIEDETLVAELVVDIADDMGANAVVIATHVEQALACIADRPWDLAILDHNLNGTPSWPVADALKRRGIPYLVVSGYGGDIRVDASTILLAKPYNVADFVAAIRKVTAPGATPSGSERSCATL